MLKKKTSNLPTQQKLPTLEINSKNSYNIFNMSDPELASQNNDLPFNTDTFSPNEKKRIAHYVEAQGANPTPSPIETFTKQNEIDTSSEAFQISMLQEEKRQMQAVKSGGVALSYGSDIVLQQNNRGEMLAKEARNAIEELQELMQKVTRNEKIITLNEPPNIIDPEELKRTGQMDSLAGKMVGTLSALTRHSLHRLTIEEGQLDIVKNEEWIILGSAVAAIHSAKSEKPDQIARPTLDNTVPEVVKFTQKAFAVGNDLKTHYDGGDAAGFRQTMLDHNHFLAEIGLPGPTSYGYDRETAVQVIDNEIAKKPNIYLNKVGSKTFQTIGLRVGQILGPSSREAS